MKILLSIAIAGSLLSCAPVLAQPDGRSGNHYNFAVAGAAARASASSAAYAIQGQQQSQSQSLRNSNRNTAFGGAGGAGGSSTVAIDNSSHTPWWGYGGGNAPSLSGTVGNGVCSSQLGLSLGFIGSFGILVPVSDQPCNARADFITYNPVLRSHRRVYDAYPAANSESVRAAYKAAGY